MGIIIFFLILGIETLPILLHSIAERSSPSEAIFLGYSAERLALVGVILVLLAGSLICVLEAARYRKNRSRWMHLILDRDHTLLFMILSIFLFLLAVVFILTQDISVFGTMDEEITRMRPFLTWLAFLLPQVLILLMFWYGLRFLEGGEEEDSAAAFKELNLVLILFTIFLIIKVVFIIPDIHGFFRGQGESNYYRMAEALSRADFLGFLKKEVPVAPFLYPISLMPAFSFAYKTFDAIKWINSLWAASSIFPIYLICRNFLSSKGSAACVVIAMLVPFQFLMPTRVLSENLFFPLFFWVLLLTGASPSKHGGRIVWDMLLGILLGLMYLTRYITLALIPFLFLAWWLKPFSGARGMLRFSWRKALHAGGMALLIALVFFVWVRIGLENELSLGHMLGFSITRVTNPAQLTLANLGKWLLLYLGYLVLIAAPVLPLLFSIPKREHLSENEKRWLTLFALVAGAFLIAVTRHSWRAYYNLEMPVRIMGRYLVYLPVLSIICAFFAFERQRKSAQKSSGARIAISSLIAAGLVLVSYWMLVSGRVFRIGPDFIQPDISIDIFQIISMGAWFFVLAGVAWAAAWLLRKKSSTAWAMFALCLAIYYISGHIVYRQFLDGMQRFQSIGAQVVKVMEKNDRKTGIPNDYVVLLPESCTESEREKIELAILARNIPGEFQLATYPKMEEFNLNAPNTILVRLGTVDPVPGCEPVDQIIVEGYSIEFYPQEYLCP